MKVSVIIPNFNHGQFLEQRINSVLNQTYQNFEIIILDDVSTDGSRAEIEKYRGNPKVVEIVYNEVNSGSTFKQWQKGLGIAKGDIIWIAESDDWCENNLLEVLVQGMQGRPGCILAYAQTYCVDTHGNIWWISKVKKLEEYMDGKAFIENHMVKGSVISNASMAIFKREAFLKMPHDFPAFRYFGDWLFWIETARQGEVFISGRVLNFFRRHTAAVSEEGHATGLNIIENLQIFRFLKKYAFVPENMYRQLIFLKYKTFSQNKKKYTPEAAGQITTAFLEMFPNQKEGKRYLLYMQVKSSLRGLTGNKG